MQTHCKDRLLVSFFCLLLMLVAPTAYAMTVEVNNEQDIINALSEAQAGASLDFILGSDISITNGIDLGTGDVSITSRNPNLPFTISGNGQVGSAFTASGNSNVNVDGVRFVGFTNSVISVANQVSLTLNRVTCENNGSAESVGACVNANTQGQVSVRNSTFENNIAAFGGALFIASPIIKITLCVFLNNFALQSGGDIAITPLAAAVVGTLFGVWIEQNIFRNSQAGLFGASLFFNQPVINPGNSLPNIHIAMNVFFTLAVVNLIEAPYFGLMFFVMNSVFINGDLFNTLGLFYFAGNLIRANESSLVVTHSGHTPQIDLKPQAVCNVFGGGGALSLGFNVLNTSGCPLTESTDRPNTNPGFLSDDPELNITLGSPAIDAQDGEGLISLPSMVMAMLPEENGSILPCGVADTTGLGRPQDGDGNGVFECDLGAREFRNGADISAAQTMAVFDANRIGEGQFLEILPGGLGAMSYFTFGPNGGQDWFIALGRQAGNTVVFNSINDANGGVWGNAFDPSTITRTNAGQASFVFPNCQASDQPGRFMFQAATGTARSDVFNRATRLSTSINCSGQLANPNSRRTGSYFGGATRNGEGMQYIELNNGLAVAVFYGYDPQGNKFWTTSAPAAVNGNTVTLQMQYPATTTGFGVNFDPDEIQTQPFGTMTLTFNADGTLTFSMNPVVPGFEAISYTMLRLTTPLGLGS